MPRTHRTRSPMPLADGLPPEATALHEELVHLIEEQRPEADSFWHNGGTAAALLLTGAATITAAIEPVVAAVCSSLATALIAIGRALDFGGRWRWHLQRRSEYSRLVYRLNAVALLAPGDQRAGVRAVYEALIEQKALDAGIPGAGEVGTVPADTPKPGAAPQPGPGEGARS